MMKFVSFVLHTERRSEADVRAKWLV